MSGPGLGFVYVAFVVDIFAQRIVGWHAATTKHTGLALTCLRMATWLREGWCRHAIFNLQLPLKKRWDETRLCLDRFAEQAQRPLLIRARQIYHDREEITVFAGTPPPR